MRNENLIESFQYMPVPKLVISNAFPAIAGMMMVLVYNLADTFFIGQTHDAYQVAAVSLATPIFLIFMSLGSIFGIGGTSVISRALGEGRLDYARKVSSFCMWSCILLGMGMSIVFLIFIDPIMNLIGASTDTFTYARTYLIIVTYGGPFVLISSCFSNILRAEGQVKKAMMGQVLGNLFNLVLDPIMILSFGWGIKGAAIATVIGNVIGASYYIFHFLKGDSMLSIHIRDFTIKDKIVYNVFIIGIPAALATVLMSISQIIMNSIMVGYGDMALAGIGVAMKVVMITGMFSMGIGLGIQPILGYCVGAKLWHRFEAIMKFSAIFAFLLSLGLTLICYLTNDLIVSWFLKDKSAFDFATNFVRIMLTTSTLFGVFYTLTNALQALGAGRASLIINLSRQGLIYIPALFILSSTLGITGIVWAQPVADIISTGLAIILYVNVLKKMTKTSIYQTVA